MIISTTSILLLIIADIIVTIIIQVIVNNIKHRKQKSLFGCFVKYIIQLVIPHMLILSLWSFGLAIYLGQTIPGHYISNMIALILISEIINIEIYLLFKFTILLILKLYKSLKYHSNQL